MAIKREKNNYSVKNKFSTLLMGAEPNMDKNDYLDLKFILTKTKRLRLRYGLNVLNEAIEYAQNLGYSGVVVNDKTNLTDLIKKILDQFLGEGYIKKESNYYVFDSTIKT